MSIIEGIVYGLIQGLTEFLPVSSSGHLALAQNLFGVSATGSSILGFNVLLHLATLTAVCTVYYKDVVQLFFGFFSVLKKLFTGKLKVNELVYSERLFIMTFFATLPLIPFVLIKDLLEAVSSVSWAIGILLIINGGVLYISDKLARNSFSLENSPVKKAFFPGAAQVLGLLPGISRSGITITGGLAAGFKREDCVKFSFIMSLPAILGSSILELPDFFSQGIPSQNVIPIILGTVVAAVSGFGAIKLLQYVSKRKGFFPFAIYCVAVGVAAIIADIII